MLSRSATRPRRHNAPRPAGKSARGYLQWLRGRDCLVPAINPRDCLCGGRMEAAHVDYAGDKGMATKVSDRFAVPLCTDHHREQHRLGWAPFEREFLGGEGKALKASEVYWGAWPGRRSWEAKNG